MNQEEQHDYAEGWNDIGAFLDRCSDQELVDLYVENRKQARDEQPTSLYFWGGFEHMEGIMYARGLMELLD